MISAAAIAKAAALGHDLENDPPPVLSTASRMTCRKCGRAVLNAGGPDYGSALTEPCNGVSS